MPVATRIQQPKFLQPEFSAVDSLKQPLKTSLTPFERRRVHFKETVSVRPIPHVNSISEEEIADVWFSKREFDDMKKSFVVTLRLMAYGELEPDDDAHCARGLEFRTRPGALERRENKCNALNAVLDEQDRQTELGISDDKLLSQKYITENHRCRVSALKLGRRDEEEARALYRSPVINDDDMADDSASSDDEMDFCFTNATSMSLRAPSSTRTTTFRLEE